MFSWLRRATKHRPASVSEAEFLERIGPAGLDWRRTVDELCDLYGTQAISEHASATYLPATTILTSMPIRFCVRLPTAHDHRPPEEYGADVDAVGDAERNFDWLIGDLSPLLGSGSCCATSNTMGRAWELGALRVRAVAWPRRLNGSDARPDAHLTIRSSVPRDPPDESLRSVAALDESSRVAALNPLPPGWLWHLRRENFATAANPAGVFEAMVGASPILWRDDATGRIGLSGAAVSFVFPRSAVTSLGLRDQPPDRSPWCSRGIEVLLRRKRGGITRVALGDAHCHMNDWSIADPTDLARRLAAFWNVPTA